MPLIKNAVERHSDTKVLENSASTLEILCTEDHAIFSRCAVVRSTIIDLLVSNLLTSLDDLEALIAGVSCLLF